MKQKHGDEACSQALRPTVPTNFWRTNDVQQPNPLSISPLSAPIATQTKYNEKKLCGRRNFEEEEALWKKRRENVSTNCSSFTRTRQLIF